MNVIAQLAVVVYGVLTLILAAGLAAMQHSVIGMALAFAASGLAYLFQFVQLLGTQYDYRAQDKIETGLIAFVILLTVASALVSTMGY